MIQHIAQTAYLQMPWKNKKGITSQIYIDPVNATLDELNFHFRLSTAPIHEKTIFSKFPGFSRLLMPIKGNGFSLNGEVYELYESAFFSGDDEVICELIDGHVVDLGIIFNSREYKAHVKILKFKKNFILNKDFGSTFLVYILQNSLTVNGVTALEGDTILVTESETLRFEAPKNSSIALFVLEKVL